MKTIEITLYKFEELSKEAQQKAINKFNQDQDFYYIYDDAHQTVKEFNCLFGTQEGRNSWLNVDLNHFEDDILNLSGFRLQKYIYNNFGYKLFARKYLKHGELTEVKKPAHKMRKQTLITSNCANKGKYSISYYSNIQKDNDCVLTGVCYDYDILQPIYDFLNMRDFKNNSTTFEDLLKNCFSSLKKSIDQEVEYLQTDEAIIEAIESNEYYFTSNGEIY